LYELIAANRCLLVDVVKIQ